MSNELAKITRRQNPKPIPVLRQFAIEFGKKSGGERNGDAPRTPSLRMWDSTHPSWVGENPACVPY